MRKQVHVIPLDQLADPPPLWKRVYFLLRIRARLIPIKVIFTGWFILAFLLNLYVVFNISNVIDGTVFELGLLLGLSFFSLTLIIPSFFINSDRVYFLSFLLSCFGVGCGGMLLATFLFG